MEPIAANDSFEVVDAAGLDRQLQQACSAVADRRAGLFGPGSVTWQVNREAAIFLGAGRALLMQLAHPWVAEAIEQHSDTFANPIGRFHRTFRVMFTMVFGSLDQSLAVARRLHRRHGTITGRMASSVGRYPAGSPYMANAVPALRWVHATLVDSALVAYGLALPPLSPEEREAYYADSRRLASLFGIPQAEMPGGWADFCAYMDAMTSSGSLRVSPSARIMAGRLLDFADVGFPVPIAYKALTASLLPPWLRKAYALPFGAQEGRTARKLVRRVRRIYPHLPGWLRHVGPYREAIGRLAGRDHSGPVTRLSNRVWIGETSMPRVTGAEVGRDP